MFASNLSADDYDEKSLYAAIGIDKNVSTIETDYTSFQDLLDEKANLIDESKLADIFDIANIKKAGGLYVANDKDDPMTGIANLEYIQQLTNMNALIRALDKNLKTVKTSLDKGTYAGDKATNTAILKYYTDLKAWLIAKTAVNYAGIYSAQKAANTKDVDALYKQLATDQTAIKTAYGAVPAADKAAAFTAAKDMYTDLKVDKPDYEESDIKPTMACDKDKEDCDTKAKQFMSSMLGKGKQPDFVDVETKKASDCAFDKIAGAVSVIFQAGQVFCMNEVRKKGMVHADGSPNKSALSCLSLYKVFGNKNTTMINNYIDRLDSAGTVNLTSLTSGTGTTSLGMGAFYASNVLAAAGTGTTTTNTNASTNTTATTTTTPTAKVGMINSAGDGVPRYNLSQATSFYNGASSTYKDMGSDAKSLISTYKPIYTQISGFNNDLSAAIVASNPKVANIAGTEKNWAISTLNKASVSTTTQQQKTDYLRLEFSKQQAAVNAIIEQMYTAKKNLGMANFMALYGSEQEAATAATQAADDELTFKALAVQGKAASSRLGLLMGSLGLGSTPYYNQYANFTMLEKAVDLNCMYAANGNKNMPRALKLENIKTPINLKKGWEKDFQAYIDDMSTRSAEAKKEMEQAKEKIKKFIAQKLPVVPFNKLPQPGEIRDELINMQALRQASSKNIKIINSAMAYHDGRKNAYSSDQYSTFKNEHDAMNGAMKRTISSIETAEQPVSDARQLIKDLYKEVPRAEALKIIAKHMVAEGR